MFLEKGLQPLAQAHAPAAGVINQFMPAAGVPRAASGVNLCAICACMRKSPSYTGGSLLKSLADKF
jgi:hypothetical protein